VKKTISLIIILSMIFQICMPIIVQSEVQAETGDVTNITFEDVNLYNAITESLAEKITEKNDELKQVTISDEQLVTIEALNLENKGIENLSGIENFTSLKELVISNNNIEDITTLFSINTLEKLVAQNNKIQSLEGIDLLTNLTELNVMENKIKEIPELGNIQDDKLNISWQKFTKTIISGQNGNIEIELPEIFIQAQDENSRYYSEEELVLTNCELSEDGTKIIVDAETVFKTNANIQIPSGALEGSYVHIYGVGIKYYTDYTNIALSLYNIDLDINADGEVTLADADLIKKYIDEEYPEERTEEEIEQINKIVYIDVDDNKEINNIDYNRFVKYINNETEILFTEERKSEGKTNENIIAQIFTHNPSIETNDEMYIFTENGEKEITFLDEDGEQQVLLAAVNYIDKEAPGYEISYSTTDATRDSVIVTITATEELVDTYQDYEIEDEEGNIVLVSEGWTLLEDKITLTKEYTENKFEQIGLNDEAGNYTVVDVEINNIYTDAPASGELIIKKQNAEGQKYEENTWTNENVYITINEETKPENVTMTYQINGEGNYTGETTLTEEGTYEIILTTADALGNSTTRTYHVKIDKTKPEGGQIILRSESSNGDELKSGDITGQNVYVAIEEGKDELSGIAETYYLLNGEETKITQSEIYRNEGTYQIKLISVDKAGNISEQEYSFEINKEKPELDVQYEKQDDGTMKVTIVCTNNRPLSILDGWELSGNRLELTKIYNVNKTEEITVTDILGNTAKVTVEVTEIDTLDFLISVDYSTKELTNQNVIVTITSVTPMKQISGWTSQNDYKQTKIYTSNVEETLTVESTTGKTVQANIVIENIDKTAPQVVSVNYSTQNITNGDVVVTITADEELQPVNGWRLSSNNKVLEKSFSQNTNGDEAIVIKDLAGNQNTATYNVSNIDKTAPTITVSKSTSGKTNQDVIVTITSNEALQEVEGWTRSGDKKKLEKSFSDNISEQTITVRDLAGNPTTVTFKVDNIDKTAARIVINYSTREETYDPVTVTLNANEELQELEGWTMSNGNKTLQKTFTENTTQTITVRDLAGNPTNVSITINNIKHKQDIKDDVYEITEDNYILGIEANTQIETVLDNLGGVTVDNPSTGIVKTGQKITVDGVTYTLIVKGDITKDGQLDIQDLSNLCSYLVNLQQLQGDALKAADMNLDKTTDMIDLSIMCLKLANLN